MKISFYTLGCKVNQNETGALEQMFENAGYELQKSGQPADVYVVNSCTVTEGGDAKSKQWLRKAKRSNPNAITVLTGCFPQAFPEKALLPDADVVAGTAGRGRLVDNVEKFLKTGVKVVDIQAHEEKEAFEELPAQRMSGRTRAFVKIEDGCNRRCAYCVIPIARGNVRSRLQESILQELQQYAKSGCAEVVFTGINLPSYGKDTGTNLAEIVLKASEIEGIERIRLSSLDPDLITQKQVEVFAKVGKLCRQFHLSLQSGCDETLKRMRRPYTAQAYEKAALALLKAMPNASFTTDVIVGFPGETEDEFKQSMAFVKKMRFLKVHVFPYSARQGTPAASFENQISKQVKTQRAKQMQKMANEVRADWILGQKGIVHSVLLEKEKENGFTGYTKSYIPVIVEAEGCKTGDIIDAVVLDFDGERCKAKRV